MSSISTLLNLKTNNIYFLFLFIYFLFLVIYYLSYICVLVINIHTYKNKVIVVEEKKGRRAETILLQELTVPCYNV